MPRPLPDYAERAKGLRFREVQFFTTDKPRASIKKSLNRAGLVDYRLERCAHGWCVWLSWPEVKRRPRRATSQAQLDALAKGRKLSPLKMIKAKPEDDRDV